MTTKARTVFRPFFLTLLGLAMAVTAGLLPFSALAQDGDLRGTAAQVAPHLTSTARLIAFVCYVIGTAFAVRALFALKAFIDKPDDNPITRFIGFSAVSVLLIMLPYSIGLTQNTLQLKTATVLQNTASFDETDKSECAGDKSLNAVFCNLVVELSPFAKFLALVTYVISAVLLLTGLINLKSYGDDPTQIPLRSIIMKFVLATFFITLPFAMNIFVSTVTGKKVSDTTADVGTPKLFKGEDTLKRK